MKEGHTAAELNGDRFDETLWKIKKRTPQPLPETINVLEVFAGCGGLHMEGSVSTPDGSTVNIKTLAAVEIEPVPCRSYKANFPQVNVYNMGVTRFLATARRIYNLKTSNASESDGKIQVLDMDIESEGKAIEAIDAKMKGSQLHRQEKDRATIPQRQGVVALPWLQFKVKRGGAAARWEADGKDPALQAAVWAYLNGPSFGPHKFPLPGDVHLLTGGPPCQGWSGYNTTRITGTVLKELMAHDENQLILRYLEIVWFYDPLYMIMEEVPDVAKKDVMKFLKDSLEERGFNMQFDKSIRTGRYGCPQTRDRLIVFGAQAHVQLPALGHPLHAKYERDEDAITLAFQRSMAAHPIPMHCSPVPAAGEGASEGAAAAASPAAAEPASPAAAPVEEEPAWELEEQWREYKGDPDDRKALMAWKRGKRAAEGQLEREKKAWQRKNKAPTPRRARHASQRNAAPVEDPDAGLMRALVLGDSLSCDLPKEAQHVRGSDGSEDYVVEYACAPPTPYIAYLRQSGHASVSNHVIYQLGVSDQLRCNLVQYRTEASWRTMCDEDAPGEGDKFNTLYKPMMMQLTEEEWHDHSTGVSCQQRAYKQIPGYMLQNKNKQETGDLPAVKERWAGGVAGQRFPLVPYWCLTMKHGQDQVCYGRLDYKDPHLTVHSYHKPHWHQSLVPFAARVMSVREKARIQGFPDTFVFYGTVDEQYKQIGNAVSPQLAKNLCRGLLQTHLRSLGRLPEDPAAEPASPALTWSLSLQTFQDFMATFDVGALPAVERYEPGSVDRKPALVPMTYEEILIWYNTEQRNDHSIRNVRRTPFDVLEHCEGFHMWQIKDCVGIRKVLPTEGKDRRPYLEIALTYYGFQQPEWSDFIPQDHRRLQQWKLFVGRHEQEVNAVINARGAAHFCLEGIDADAPAGTHPMIATAIEEFEVLKARYQAERQDGHIPAGASKGKNAPADKKAPGAGRKRKAAAAASDRGALEPLPNNTATRVSKRPRRSQAHVDDDDDDDFQTVEEKKVEQGGGQAAEGASEDPESDPGSDSDLQEDEFQVEAVLGAKKVKGQQLYLVKWAGYGEEENTWEPRENFDNDAPIKAYEKSQGKKRGRQA